MKYCEESCEIAHISQEHIINKVNMIISGFMLESKFELKISNQVQEKKSYNIYNKMYTEL